MEEVAVRPACLEDLPAIGLLYGDLYDLLQGMGLPFALDEAGLQGLLPVLFKSKMCCLAVAETPEGEICGFLSAAISRMDRKLQFRGENVIGKISDICVAEAYRGRNVAGRLLQYAESWMKDCGVTVCESEIVLQNARSLGFFQKNGYTPFCTLTYKALSGNGE